VGQRKKKEEMKRGVGQIKKKEGRKEGRKEEGRSDQTPEDFT